ncbi:Lpg1974 family pore-forming outer membrane protein [Roseimaritima sediminicola]|uniref:Lpg1974 family pore-forming outer membrane protein n=1 Tax=Roseimaritima sediminicola TaxID=2662066 RepID=UPI00129851EC|nr:Lpg1974 family pore-forming outer membrane protein [Roseimaritima sediminicola]
MSRSLLSRMGRGVAAAGLAFLGGTCAVDVLHADEPGQTEAAARLDEQTYQEIIDQHLYGGVEAVSHEAGYVLNEPQSPAGDVGLYYGESCGCGAPVCDGGCGGGRKFKRRAKRSGSLLGGLCETDRCPQPWWAHRNSAYGEFLLLTAGSSDIIHAAEYTGPTAADTPTGPLGIVDLDAEAGFRVGASLAASQCSSLHVGYSYWSGSDTDTLNATGTNVLNSQILHPSLLTTGAASLQASAQHDMSFQTLDVNYRHLWKRSNTMALNWSGGVRYGNMEQNLIGAQTVQVATGLTTVTTDIDFDGFGITGGLDFERYSCETGLFCYGKGMVSLLAGEWKANYRQVNQFGGGRVGNDFEDFRATPILEGEIGLGWQKQGGRVRAQIGYLMSGWYDSISTRGYVDAVRRNNLLDVDETITFSGLTTRLTMLF